MPDDVPQVPLTPNPPIPSADGVPAKDANHQLQYLPSLSPEPDVYWSPTFWLCCLFVISVIVVILVCRHHDKFDTVATVYIGDAVTLFSLAIGGNAANNISKKLVYYNAAGKDGVNSNIPQDGDADRRRDRE